MILGYNTNGLAHHAPRDALALLSDLGYRAVGLTIDHHLLSPFDRHSSEQLKEVRQLLQQFGMRSAIETGARFLLDPRNKHEPTLVTASAEGRQRRIEFYRHAVRCAAELESDCVSLWSGVCRHGDRQAARAWFIDGLAEVCRYARRYGVTVALEPEPGMLVATTADYEAIRRECDEVNLRLTLDVGHVHCSQEGDIAAMIRRVSVELANVHIEDMRRGVHEHLLFGEGEIDFPPVLQSLVQTGYNRGVYAELSRHSHCAPEAARRTAEFLSAHLVALRSSGA